VGTAILLLLLLLTLLLLLLKMMLLLLLLTSVLLLILQGLVRAPIAAAAALAAALAAEPHCRNLQYNTPQNQFGVWNDEVDRQKHRTCSAPCTSGHTQSAHGNEA
jgi:hypothetical protein